MQSPQSRVSELVTSVPLLLVGLAMLAGCGPRWYYPNLDWLIPWYVDDYISLDRGQKSALGERLDRVLDWHCRTQLSEYAGFLRAIRQEIDRGSLTAERLAAYQDRLDDYWKVLMARIGPDIVPILASASDTQIRELFENLERGNRELEETFVDPPADEILRNRQKRMEKRLRYWLSDLTESQRAAVADWSGQLLPISADWIENRRKIQGEFRRLLEQRRQSTRFETDFMALLTNPESVRSEVYRYKVEFNTERTLTLLARLITSLTADQRAHLSDRLESLAEDFESLRCGPAQ